MRVDPTGHRIAFLSCVPELSFRLTDRTEVADNIRAHALWVIDVDGTRCDRISLNEPVMDPEWARDGQTIAARVMRDAGDRLVLVSLARTEKPQNKSHAVDRWVLWPTGPPAIACVDTKAGNVILKRIADGRLIRNWPLPSHDEAVLCLAPASNGNSLFIQTESGAYLATTSCRRPERILTDLTNPAEASVTWSPDSRRIALFRVHFVESPTTAFLSDRYTEVEIRSGDHFRTARSVAGQKSDTDATDCVVLRWADANSLLVLEPGDDGATKQIKRVFADGAHSETLANFGADTGSLAVYSSHQ